MWGEYFINRKIRIPIFHQDSMESIRPDFFLGSTVSWESWGENLVLLPLGGIIYYLLLPSPPWQKYFGSIAILRR